jgi:predicted nucleic acid-binding Zn ribbon protein
MAREPTRLGSAISELIAIRGFNQVNASQQLADAWKIAAGPVIAGKTKTTGLRNGVLQVAVSNSTMLGELKSFHHAELLIKLQKSEPSIRDIRYRLNSNL